MIERQMPYEDEGWAPSTAEEQAKSEWLWAEIARRFGRQAAAELFYDYITELTRESAREIRAAVVAKLAEREQIRTNASTAHKSKSRK